MSWIRGTATSWTDLSNDLVEAASGTSINTPGISSGGTGYTVGDILTVVGGTSTIAAQIEVTSVAAGVIDGVRIYNAGVYTVAPSSPNSVTGGTGTTASLTFASASNGWTVDRNIGTALSSVDSVAAGGTGYSVNDVITLAGGDGVKTAATLTVLTLSGSSVATVSITEAGDYGAVPADPVAQASVAPAGGSGATFNVTWEAGERDVVMHGSGGGADAIYVGWRTFSNSGASRWALELHGMTGYTSTVPMVDQPGVSPGFWDAAVAADKSGCYFLSNNSSQAYWLSITSYRIILVAKVGSAYFNGYLGWGNRFATASEYPYPLIVAGHSSNPEDIASQGSPTSGLTDPWRDSGSPGNSTGPMQLRFTDGQWYGFWNQTTAEGATNDRVVLPCGVPNIDNGVSANNFVSFTAGVRFRGLIQTQSGATPVANLYPTPSTAEQHVMWPCPLVFSTPSINIPCELDDVFWVHAFGSVNLQSEDRHDDGTHFYRIFQNCNRTDLWAFLAIKEN